jgi:hypothetical protein
MNCNNIQCQQQQSIPQPPQLIRQDAEIFNEDNRPILIGHCSVCNAPIYNNNNDDVDDQ